MRAYILTEIERTHLTTYLKNSETSDDFYVLLNRINKYYNRLLDDINLIQMVLKKRGEK